MAQRPCKYCGLEVQWVKDEGGHWLAINLRKIDWDEAGAEWVVIGPDDARRVLKRNRAKYVKLYDRHVCAQGENARKMAKRERKDRDEKRALEAQLEHEAKTLPENVSVLSTYRKLRGK
jgi:hypothetical protein